MTIEEGRAYASYLDVDIDKVWPSIEEKAAGKKNLKLFKIPSFEKKEVIERMPISVNSAF